MKTLGLIGGMSWESTTHYYQLLNRMARDRFGARHSAPLILWSVDFAPVAELQEAGEWAKLGAQMAQAARRLEDAGAQAIVICANTMHLLADDVIAATGIPLIHIVDATAEALKARGAANPLLFATRFTMEKPFWRDRLKAQGVSALIPNEADRARLHAIIFDELVQGRFDESSRQVLHGIAEAERRARGIDGVILGCTEFGMLTPASSYMLPAVDTAEEHCRAAIAFAAA